MKKQVYKVGDLVRIEECMIGNSKHEDCVGKIVKKHGNGLLEVSLGDDSCSAEKVTLFKPLKPKKSIKKKETKVQELERRIKALEAHRCNPMPQPLPYNPPYIPEQVGYRCPACGLPVGNLQVHYCS